MSIRAIILAGLLGLPLVAGSALAAETKNLSLTDAAKQGDREAVRSLLNGGVASPEASAALIWAATRGDVQMVDLLLRAGANPKGANEYGATALYAAAANADRATKARSTAAVAPSS